jgi:hypothetical protein
MKDFGVLMLKHFGRGNRRQDEITSKELHDLYFVPNVIAGLTSISMT